MSPAARSASASSIVATPSHSAPGVAGGPGGLGHAVPVAVGLDHDHQRTPGPTCRAERADVVPDRRHVDDDLGARGGLRHGARMSPTQRAASSGTDRRGDGVRHVRRRPAARPRRRWSLRGAVQPGADRGRVVRRQAGRQQRADQPAEHVAGAGGGEPGGAGRVGADPPVRAVATSVRRPLSSTTASYRSAAAPDVVQRPRLDVLALRAEHRRELAGVRREHGRHRHRVAEVLERVGVDHQSAPRRRAPRPACPSRRRRCRSRRPRPGPGRRRPPRDAPRAPWRRRRRRRRTAPSRPARSPRRRRTAGRRRGTRADPARTPTTPRVYLCASPAGRGSRAATSSTCSDSTAASGRSRPMSTRCTAPHAAAAGSTRCATLWVPNVTVRSATDVVAVQLAGVDVDAARGVDRDHRYAVQQPHHPRRLGLQARPAADADDPVDHHVRALGRLVDDPPAGAPAARPARPRARCSDSSTASTPHAPPGQHRPGVQRVPAVVARRRPAAAPGARTPTRAGRPRRTPAPPPPAASARPPAASPSAPPRPPAPARPCGRAAWPHARR